MPRARVLSFMSQWGGGLPRSPPPSAPSSPTTRTPANDKLDEKSDYTTYVTEQEKPEPHISSSAPPSPSPARQKSHSRRGSMVLAYQPPTMDASPENTLPELLPILSYLNGHANKLYQEGYFLKLHDLDSRGRPSADRVWNECFAQLVGTVLSLWDAAELDAAGEDGEVMPTFINLTDASIKMIESLPMNGPDGQSLQNVLSISTAANNRYLLHFNSLHSLTQWTAGIRLAIYEQATLQEAYTGSIIAGKGKHLNNIRTIMERSRFCIEDWARVRFGAGTPWRRCWCVITPPDEKDVAKAAKLQKKKSAYDRKVEHPKGTIKFYESKKINKKTKPIATVNDAFSAYAIYPQSKALIDASSLVKVEGTITIHSSPETTTEGFVFVMPEVHPAITGFEMMLRWLLPTFDTFALYGRPDRLVADVLDTRSLMFAMPTNKRYGYLDLIDVAGLIHTEGSSDWSEKEWRKQMKLLVSKRITSGIPGPERSATGNEHQRGVSRSSLNLPTQRGSFRGNARGSVQFNDASGARSSPSSRRQSPGPQDDGSYGPPPRVDSDSALVNPQKMRQHQRAVSEANGYRRGQGNSRLSFEVENNDNVSPPPPPPPHAAPPTKQMENMVLSSDEDWSSHDATPEESQMHAYPGITGVGPDNEPYRPVEAPPVMAHKAAGKPPVRPAQMPDMRRANSAVDAATLAQLRDINRARQESTKRQSKDDSQMAYGQQMPPSYQPPQYQQQQPPQYYPQQAPAGQYQPGPYPPQNYYDMQHPFAQYSQRGRAPVAPPSMGPANGGLQQPRQRGPGNGRQPAMPTIPGTPGLDSHDNQFDMAAAAANVATNGGELRSAKSQSSINRKPLPSRVQ